MSTAFPGCAVRGDARDKPSEASPFGTVNVQSYAGSWEAFKVKELPGLLHVALESVAFPGCYLRGDGEGVTDIGGTVNFQTYPGSWETWRVHEHTLVLKSFESTSFPGCFLRLDGTGVDSPLERGGGTVNLRKCTLAELGDYEKFRFEIYPDYGGEVPPQFR